MGVLKHLAASTGPLNLVRIVQVEQPVDDILGCLFGTHLGRVDSDFRITRRFVRTVNTGEVL
jgi:hypothetical protein